MNLFGGDDGQGHDDPDQGLIFDQQAPPVQPETSEPGQWARPTATEQEPWAQPSYQEESWLDHDDEPEVSRSLLPQVGLGILACVVLIALGFFIARMLGSTNTSSTDSAIEQSPGLDADADSSLSDDGVDPVETTVSIPEEIVLAPIGLSCVVELADQPSGAEFVIGESPTDCPDLAVWNQYDGYVAGDLLPWTEGVEECWVGDQVVQMWIGVQLSEAERGWLPLTPGTKTDRFKDGLVDVELFATASANSLPVGSFSYSDLRQKVFAVRLDLPEAIDPPPEDKTHLGGCWQADRTNTLGLQFYWPAGVDV